MVKFVVYFLVDDFVIFELDVRCFFFCCFWIENFLVVKIFNVGDFLV